MTTQLGYRLNNAKKIAGWMSDAELGFLAQASENARVIYEIGCFLGRSTRAIADNTRGVVYAIDPWNAANYNDEGTGVIFTTNSDMFNQFYCNLSDHIDRNRVIPCCFRWNDFTPPVKADFIFIDGDHRYDSVVHDIMKAKRCINKRGVIAGHDYHDGWPGVKRAVEEIFGKVNTVDSIWWVTIP